MEYGGNGGLMSLMLFKRYEQQARRVCDDLLKQQTQPEGFICSPITTPCVV
jgi:hypothetical protein